MNFYPDDKETHLLWLFDEVHGTPVNCDVTVVTYERYDSEIEEDHVAVLKDGVEAWRATKSDLILAYLAKTHFES